jgi:hypothetical protein
MKNFIEAIGGLIGILAFVKGILEFVELNRIRRYEKFHEMSKRFDENESIQKVCELLQDSSSTISVTKQEKEVFICFLEEIYFMIMSGIMKKEIALYTFGYYAREAMHNQRFWHALDSGEEYYTVFHKFCRMVSIFEPSQLGVKKTLKY